MLKAKIKRTLPGFDLDVELTLNRELMAILGPSGSGKTMTLQCIAGLTRPDEGYIELGGKVLFDFSLALLIGVLIGTYSSIFVASPLIYLWRKKLR